MKLKMEWLLLLLVFAAIAHSQSQKNVITGYARVVDGDTIVVNGHNIRLHGIDAPEKKQTLGAASTSHLRRLLHKRKVRCNVASEDRYKRKVARCTIKSYWFLTLDVNRNMVVHGLAYAYRDYSDDYIIDEEYAKKRKEGVWSLRKRVYPWDYRKAKRNA